MWIVMTILGCVLFAQLSADQGQAGASPEPAQQAAAAEENRPNTDTIPPADQAEAAANTWAAQSEAPAASSSSSASSSSADHSATTGEAAAERPSMLFDRSASLHTRPPQLIAEAMTLPQGSPVTGQPLQLVQALSSTPDRRQQLTIANAYWQAVEAIAKYHYCLDHENLVARLEAAGNERASLQAARSAATAKLREAELAARSAQHDLAVLMRYPPDAPLPFPADRPHVGAYRTNFQELFATRTAPDRARLIDRTLPIRRMAIDQRATAAEAAHDALIAATDAHQAGSGALTGVIANAEQLIGQQIAFIETVCRYNKDIAEYAVTVAGPGVTPQILAGYMIKTQREPAQTLISEGEGEVRQAALNEPANPPPARDSRAQPIAPQTVPRASAIPAVPPATQWGAPRETANSIAPLTQPPGGASAAQRRHPTPAQPRKSAPAGTGGEPASASPRSEIKSADESLADPTARPSEEPAKIRYNVSDPFLRGVQKVNKPPIQEETAPDAAAAAIDDIPAATPDNQAEESTDLRHQSPASALAEGAVGAAIYPALVEASPAARAKELTLALHWDRLLPENTGTPMTLEQCLSRAGSDRRLAVEAFWIARQRAAEYQALAQASEFLDNLTPLVLERRSGPDGPAAMLFLRAARLNAKADLQEARAVLVEAQFEVAMRTQSAGESSWPLPSTAPHGGQYLLNLESQPPQVVQSWQVRRLAAAIPAYGTSLQEVASSVVSADGARARAVEKYAAGESPIDEVLRQIVTQTRQTFDFLRALTDYNRSIAQYALAVLPPDASAARVASALVVER
jgi:hypothetical protein